MNVNDFPTEVLSLILCQLVEQPRYAEDLDKLLGDRRHLLNARLVSRKWNTLATAHLFKEILLVHNDAPDEGENEFSSWNNMLDTPSIRNAARCAIINSTPEIFTSEADYETWELWTQEREYPLFTTAIDRIGELPNLKAVHLRFSRVCRGVASSDSGYDWDNDVEPIVTRQATLAALMGALSARAANPDTPSVRSLTLENLQNLPDDSWMVDGAIKDLDELHLMILEECNEHGPDYDMYREERWTYEPYFQKNILPRFADHLTTLTLGFDEYWGSVLGHFDGKGLVFPHLKTLNLIRFVIGHHDHFDWVLAQTGLTTLRLDKCLIVSHIRIGDELFQLCGPDTHDWRQQPPRSYGFCNDTDRIYDFSGRWETVFDSIRTSLVQLTDFRFGYKRFDVNFHRPEETEVRLFMSRYIVFDSGLLPSPWIRADDNTGNLSFGNNDATPLEGDDGDEYIERCELNRSKETEEGDTRAFEDLLEAVRSRW